jgi:phage terminase small subunit
MAPLANLRHESFCREYLIDLNATAAYKRAGYKATGRGAVNNASRLLVNAGIQARIAELGAERAQRVASETSAPQVRADAVLREYLALAFRDLRDIFVTVNGGLRIRPVDEWPESIGRAIESVKIKQTLEKRPDGTFEPFEILEFKLSSKTDALKALGQHLGLFADREKERPASTAWDMLADMQNRLGELSYEQLIRIHRETLNLPALPDDEQEAGGGTPALPHRP